MIKIELTKPMDRFAIIKEAKQLKSKGENLDTIYINFDLTLSQRNLRKQLLDECKSKNTQNTDSTRIYVIRNNFIKSVVKTST